HGLCITRTYPARLREQTGLQRTPIVWLSHEDSGPEMSLERPEEVYRMVRNFAGRCQQENKESLVLLDGLEYLRTRHDFNATLRLLHDLKDTAARTGATLLIPCNPEALGPQETGLLERELEALP
ncbi:MAG: DUF835 domain-containing protein, partial [Euryarchaeota archaeon]|nr:DUF835 domain-containing protein [Euryarchaeota archaeon]